MEYLDIKYFYDRWRETFGIRKGSRRVITHGMVRGINAILAAFDQTTYRRDFRCLAYILATAFHETAGRMEPVRESLATSDSQARYRLRRRWYAKTDPETGESYYGRGFVQLTHKYNYLKAGNELGVGDRFVRKPDDVMFPEISAKILVEGMLGGWFTGRKLGHYINGQRCDYYRARQVVNGMDRFSLIARYAEDIERYLKFVEE